MSAPRVAVVVPALRSGATLPDALRSVRAQTDAPILVAADPDDRDTRAAVTRLARELGEVHLVDNPGGSTPAGLNRAVEAAGEVDVVVRVDAHAVLPDGYVERAIATLAATGAGNVGGRQVPRASSGFRAAVAAAMASPAGAGGAAYRTGTEPGPVDTVYLGVYRREALAAVGGFDERLRRNQDYECNVRLRAAGWTVWFDPALEVAYTPRGTVASLARQYHDYGRWRRATLRLHPSSLRARQLAAPAVVLATLVGGILAAAVSARPLLTFLAAYLVGLLLAARQAAAGGPAGTVPTALALATMHLAWGTGFLRGVPRGALDGPPPRPDAARQADPER
ncbi:MAG: glycosyltransferase [Actinomycetes bacterium]